MLEGNKGFLFFSERDYEGFHFLPMRDLRDVAKKFKSRGFAISLAIPQIPHQIRPFFKGHEGN